MKQQEKGHNIGREEREYKSSDDDDNNNKQAKQSIKDVDFICLLFALLRYLFTFLHHDNDSTFITQLAYIIP